jgi:E3 ubiquitin-protein ligase UHRF1
MEDGYSLFDYDVGLNDLIQLMIRAKPAPLAESDAVASSSNANNKVEPKETVEENFSDKENKEVCCSPLITNLYRGFRIKK